MRWRPGRAATSRRTWAIPQPRAPVGRGGLGPRLSDYWERRLPAEMLRLASDLPDGQRFDAVVVDESQDFAES